MFAAVAQRWVKLGLLPTFALIIDALIALTLGAVTYLLFYVPIHGQGDSWQYACAALLPTVVFVHLMYYRRAYDLDIRWRLYQQVAQVALCWTWSILALLAVLFLIKSSASFSRGWMLLWYASVLVGLPAWRVALQRATIRLRRAGLLVRRAIVLGSRRDVDAATHQLRSADWISVAGTFEVPKAGTTPALDRAGEHLRQMIALVGRVDADIVLVVHPVDDRGEAELIEMLDWLRELSVDVLLCPSSSLAVPHAGMVAVGPIWAMRIWHKPLAGWSVVAKWLEDRIFATAGLAITAPLFALIAIGIKLDSPGPVFFRQQRFGLHGRPFALLKFRTMRDGLEDKEGSRGTVRNDPRVTRFGGFLRRTSLDELPQLVNVLRGEMSLIGPRAHPVEMKVAGEYYHRIVKNYMARHRVKPGMTGWAQIHGLRGGVHSIDHARRRIEYDLFYVENWTIWLDLRILIQTFVRGLVSEDAY